MARSRKTVVLLARNEGELELWRMRLETAGYRVACALSLDELRRALDENPHTLVVVSQWGSPQVAAVVDNFRGRTVGADVRLLLTDLPFSPDYRCDGYEPGGEVLVARVRNRLQILSARKRGPKPMPGPVMSQAVAGVAA